MSTSTIGKPDQTEYAAHYIGYVASAGDGDIVQTMSTQLAGLITFLDGISEEKAEYRYAPEKWSIKEVVGHLLDGEREFGHRAYRFSRNDAAPLPGFSENSYVANGRFDRYTFRDLVTELEHVRRANISLFGHMDAEASVRRGMASGLEVSVRALAYIIVGHVVHHVGILRERYGVEEQA
jgi:hypothetical protein